MEFGIFDHVDRNAAALADYYERRLALTEAYDRHGFYCYHVAEHHATPLGLASSPSVYMAAVAQRTKELRLCPLVYLLPFYHPLRLIEEICILDQMSRGRMQIGVGRGISPFETRYYGLDPDGTRALFQEELQILLKGLTQRTLNHEGPAHRFVDVPMELEPLQKPHPPLWMGVNRPDAAENAARLGANTVSLVPPEALPPIVEAYRRARKDADGAKLGLSFFIVVGDSDAEAQAHAARAYERWYASFNHLYRLHGRGPMLGEQPKSFAEMAAIRRAVAGTPDRVADFLAKAVKEAGVNYTLGQFVFGDLPHEVAVHSIDLFAAKVMPALRTAFGAVPASA